MGVKEDLYSLCQELAQEGNKILAQDQLENAKKITENAVNSFYGSYSPRLYGRGGHLGSFAHPEVNGEEFSFNLGPEYSTGGYNEHAEAVYYWVFKKGYHGGAPSGIRKHFVFGRLIELPHPHPGVPYWGVPAPFYTMWYGSPAPQSTAPFTMLTQEWNSYIHGAYEQKKEEVLNQLVEKYGDRISTIFRKAQEEGGV